MTTFAPDTTFGKYLIIRLLGQGGMADVYEAEDTRMGRRVALKLLPLSFARDDERLKRFEKEIRASAALDHPHIVSVFDVGEIDGQTFYTMSLLTGGDLKRRISSKPLDPKSVIKIISDLGDALQFAHSNGFIHRDVKPENILFGSDGRVVLTDFGITKAIGSDTHMTAAGLSIGTPHYMSPEQARGLEIDGRADLYSLGVVFYECLTGHTPYEAQDSFALGIRHINDPVPELPEELNRLQPIVDRFMAKDPEDRYQSSEEIKRDFAALQAGALPAQQQAGAAPTRIVKSVSSGETSQDSSTVRSKGALLSLIFGALAAAIIAGGYYFWVQRNAGSSPPVVAGSASGSVREAGSRSGGERHSAPQVDASQTAGSVIRQYPSAGSSRQKAGTKDCSLNDKVATGLAVAVETGEVGSIIPLVLENISDQQFGPDCFYDGNDQVLLHRTSAALLAEHEKSLAMQGTLRRALSTAEKDIDRLRALERLSEITDDQKTSRQARETLADAVESVGRIRERMHAVDMHVSRLEQVLSQISVKGTDG